MKNIPFCFVLFYLSGKLSSILENLWDVEFFFFFMVVNFLFYKLENQYLFHRIIVKIKWGNVCKYGVWDLVVVSLVIVIIVMIFM